MGHLYTKWLTAYSAVFVEKFTIWLIASLLEASNLIPVKSWQKKEKKWTRTFGGLAITLLFINSIHLLFPCFLF